MHRELSRIGAMLSLSHEIAVLGMRTREKRRGRRGGKAGVCRGAFQIQFVALQVDGRVVLPCAPHCFVLNLCVCMGEGRLVGQSAGKLAKNAVTVCRLD